MERGRHGVQQDVPERHDQREVDAGPVRGPGQASPPSSRRSPNRTSSTRTSPISSRCSTPDSAADITAYVTPKTVPALDSIDAERPRRPQGRTASSTACRPATTRWACLQPQALRAGRTRPGQAADHLGRGPRRRQEDRRRSATASRLRRVQRAEHRRLALHRGDVRPGRPTWSPPTARRPPSTTPPASRSLQHLHDMRWKDRQHGQSRSCCKWGDLQKKMVSGKLGMYLAAPDDITYMVQHTGRQLRELRHGPDPRRQGDAVRRQRLHVQEGLERPTRSRPASPGSNFKFLTPGKGQFDYARTKADGLPVGLPQPHFFTGAAKAKDIATRRRTRRCRSTTSSRSWPPRCPAKAEPPKRAGDLQGARQRDVRRCSPTSNADIDKLLVDRGDAGQPGAGERQ